MIEKRVTFILGAGAHRSYGFPSGEELKRQIIEKCRYEPKFDDPQNLYELVRRGLAGPNDVDRSKVQLFAKALKMSGHLSIDAFLDANRHMSAYELIGKSLIAQVLNKYDGWEGLFDREIEDDWLSYIFAEMLSGANTPEAFEKNRVSFITFNYDRTLEYWLHSKLVNSYGISYEKALSVLKKIPIVHIYGAIGKFPYELGPQKIYRWASAVKEIRLIYEAKHDSGEVGEAKRVLSSSDLVCILGFGFHKENIELLNLPHEFKVVTGNIWASRFGMTDVEVNRVRTRHFPNLDMRFSDNVEHRCLNALRNLYVF